MNDSLLTYSGGQPLYADDLSFMQNSLSAMTNHLSKAFGDTYVVWGCLDESKTNVVVGAVCIGGKLYEVPALGTLGENKLCYREVLSDERVFENGQKHKVKKSYEAYLSTDTSGAVAYIDLKTARSADRFIEEVEKRMPKSYKADSTGIAGGAPFVLIYNFKTADIEEGDWIMFYIGAWQNSFPRQYIAGVLHADVSNRVSWVSGADFSIKFDWEKKRLEATVPGGMNGVQPANDAVITVFKPR